LSKTLMTTMFLLLMCCVAKTQTSAQNPAQAPAKPQAPQYRLSEYPLGPLSLENDPEKQIQMLDDFVAKHPSPLLLAYAYSLYLRDYERLQNHLMVIEYADKLLTSGDKVENVMRYLASYSWCFAYNHLNSTDRELAKRARQRALEGVKVLAEIKKPDSTDATTFESQKRQPAIYFQATAGTASIILGDYGAAAEAFKMVLQLDAPPLIATTPK
jgi:hypothetical protein